MKNTADISRMSIRWNRAFDTSMKKTQSNGCNRVVPLSKTLTFFTFLLLFSLSSKKYLHYDPFQEQILIFSVFLKEILTLSHFEGEMTHALGCGLGHFQFSPKISTNCLFSLEFLIYIALCRNNLLWSPTNNDFVFLYELLIEFRRFPLTNIPSLH